MEIYDFIIGIWFELKFYIFWSYGFIWNNLIRGGVCLNNGVIYFLLEMNLDNRY